MLATVIKNKDLTMKVVLWIIGIIFLIGLLVVLGFLDFLF